MVDHTPYSEKEMATSQHGYLSMQRIVEFSHYKHQAGWSTMPIM